MSNQPHPLALAPLLSFALHAVADIGQPHRIKAALALAYLGERFPGWSQAQGAQLLAHSEFHHTPTASGLLASTVSSPMRYGPRAAERLIARGLLPLAYRAANDWVATHGLAEVVGYYAGRAFNEPGHLAHGLSIWLSFTVAVERVDASQHPLLLERFVEFAAQAYPGYPVWDSHWQPPARPAGNRSTFAEAFAVASRQPGFYGHHLIALAWVQRCVPRFAPGQLQQAYAAVIEAAQADTVFALPQEEASCSDAAWPGFLHAYLLGLRANVHAATLGDALAVLWDNLGDADRSRLLQTMAVLAANTR